MGCDQKWAAGLICWVVWLFDPIHVFFSLSLYWVLEKALSFCLFFQSLSEIVVFNSINLSIWQSCHSSHQPRTRCGCSDKPGDWPGDETSTNTCWAWREEGGGRSDCQFNLAAAELTATTNFKSTLWKENSNREGCAVRELDKTSIFKPPVVKVLCVISHCRISPHPEGQTI